MYNRQTRIYLDDFLSFQQYRHENTTLFFKSPDIMAHQIEGLDAALGQHHLAEQLEHGNQTQREIRDLHIRQGLQTFIENSILHHSNAFVFVEDTSLRNLINEGGAFAFASLEETVEKALQFRPDGPHVDQVTDPDGGHAAQAQAPQENQGAEAAAEAEAEAEGEGADARPVVQVRVLRPP